MIRYVAIGALAGFLVAYFLLSHSSEGGGLPAVEQAPPAAAYRNPAESMRQQRRPERVVAPRALFDPAADAGQG